MLVRLVAAVSGSVDGHYNPPVGAELEVSDSIGAVLVRKGLAQKVAVKAAPSRKVEAAAVDTTPARRK